MSQRNRIVLDTNCLLQIVSRHSKSHNVWREFLDGTFDLCVTNDILQEYEEILGHKMHPQIAALVVEIILRAPNTVRVDAHFHWHLIEADPDDNKFVDCAIAANACFIVSEDSHFKVLATIPYPHVLVLRLNQFVQHLGERWKD